MTGDESQAPVPHKRPAFEPPGRLLKPTGYHPDMRRPLTVVAGAALVLLRVIAGVAVLVGIAAGWDAIVAAPDTVLEGLAFVPLGFVALIAAGWISEGMAAMSSALARWGTR